MELQKIDLGLSSGTKWANCNLEATSELDGGIYIDVDDLNYHQPWKHIEGDWMLPTIAQWHELHEQCKWSLAIPKEGERYFRITGKNGNSILLPFAGYRSDYYDAEEKGVFGYYWAADTISLSSTATARYFVWLDNVNRWGSTHTAFMRQDVRLPMRFVSK